MLTRLIIFSRKLCYGDEVVNNSRITKMCEPNEEYQNGKFLILSQDFVLNQRLFIQAASHYLFMDAMTVIAFVDVTVIDLEECARV